MIADRRSYRTEAAPAMTRTMVNAYNSFFLHRRAGYRLRLFAKQAQQGHRTCILLNATVLFAVRPLLFFDGLDYWANKYNDDQRF